MGQLTGGQALVKSIIANGVDTMFVLPGVQLDHMFNALFDEGDAIRVISTRHEQGAAYMALGYAQSTGRAGAYAVVPGPGFLNTAAALSTAYATNAPVLCVTGQIPSACIGRGFGLLHEIPDQLAIVRGLTKWAARIEEPGDAPALVSEAFRQLRTGRPRPVGLEMALDTMGREAEVSLLEPGNEWSPPEVDHEAIQRAAELLGSAESPVICVGGGAARAEQELEVVAEMLQAPVLANRTGRGLLSDRHYLAQTQPAGHKLWAKADVVLAVGTRLQHQRMGWGIDDALKIIHIDVDPGELERITTPAVAICADAKAALAALIPAIAETNKSRRSREAELTALKADMAAEFEQKLGPQMAYLRAIRAELPEDGFFVEELTQVGFVARFAFPVYRPRTYVSTGYMGTLGFGFATALGVKVANPDKQVLSINGDGGFMFNVQELSSAVKHNIAVVAVVFRNDAYRNVQRMQENLYGGRVIGTDLANPDFVKLAESFGAMGYRAATPEALRLALREAFKNSGPSVIEVPIAEMPDPWSFILPPRSRPVQKSGGRS